MPKKPAYATEIDLQTAKAELEEKTDRVRQSGEKSAADVKTELKAELQKQSETITSNARTTKGVIERLDQELKEFAVQRIQATKDEVLSELPPIQQQIKDTQQAIEGQMTVQEERIMQAVEDQIMVLSQEFDKEMARSCNELAESQEKFARDAAEALVGQVRELKAEIQELREEAKTRDQDDRGKLEADLKKMLAEQKKIDEAQNDKHDRSETEIYLKLERLSDLLKEAKEGASDHTQNVEEKATAAMTEFREKSEKRFGNLDVQTEKLHDAVAEVENINTRRVDWVVRNVSKRLRPPSAGKACLHSSWFSPKFDIAGAHGVQLELQLFKGADPPVEGEAAGDCAAFLWACKGMNLVYKLYIGTKSQQLEKIFNGRVPFGTKRLCFLKDQINREEDSLRISVEILEAVREIEHPIKPPPPPEDVEEGEEVDERAKPLEGKVVFRRHLNHRLVDQVRQYVETVRSQMIRKVEWRVESASILRRCFPPGEVMCSVAFAAAGVDNLQLMFYPSGYHGVTDGFCSFFLYAPAGATMKYTLYAGSQKRDATHFFEEQGAFGRSNFCRFDAIVEEDTDSILLVLEIDEAHQDIVAKVAHPLVQAGDRRTQSQIEGAVPKAVESVVKMHRAQNKAPTAALEEKRVLPSLWTGKSLGEQKGGNEAMRGFDELKQSRGLLTSASGKRTQPASPTSQASPLGLSKSSPNLTKDFSNTTSPLPQLGKTNASDFGNFGSKKVRGASRTKSGFTNQMQVLA